MVKIIRLQIWLETLLTKLSCVSPPGAIALTFINQFWKVVYDAVLPFAEEGFEKVAKPVLNKVFLSVPYNQLFPLLPETPISTESY